ncbi:hypothetical protein BDZ45DRAFT_713293 [Acephala macrosclerotiorum]|nr:hypothetical protein BDZ45DRAFT_713293 [Acephala macrosclerotiorum]
MPGLECISALELASKAWGAISELSDNFIVKFGNEKLKGVVVGPRELDNWHADGDHFMHYLDSPEQSLLVIPCFTDVFENGSAAYICPGGIGVVARYLHDNPEGVTPYMARGEEHRWDAFQIFQQVTGNCGDVVLMHPLMMHSASRNSLHVPRIITNPFVCLNGSFNFNREDPREYSLVERKTLKELGVDSLLNWKIKGKRENLRPERENIHARMKELELRRLAGEERRKCTEMICCIVGLKFADSRIRMGAL